jgi:hypothetical protein
VLGFLTRVLAPSAYYVPALEAPGLITPVWLLMSGTIGAVSLAVAAADSDDRAVDRGFGLLLLAALLISPLGWTYYWWLALGPMVAVVGSWWGRDARRERPAAPDTGGWRRALLLAAVPGLIWPLPATIAFQPSAWATVLTGSAYFWATLALWAALIADWHMAGGRLRAVAGLMRR